MSYRVGHIVNLSKGSSQSKGFTVNFNDNNVFLISLYSCITNHVALHCLQFISFSGEFVDYKHVICFFEKLVHQNGNLSWLAIDYMTYNTFPLLVCTATDRQYIAVYCNWLAISPKVT